MKVLGVDLAWAEGDGRRAANETGVVALGDAGTVLDAGWTVGVEATVDWITTHADEPVLVFVDAPLIVENATGQRLCEKHVGQRYGRWNVSANSTNLGSARLAGVKLRERLEALGWTYSDGIDGPPTSGRTISECYPYTALVGAAEFGYDAERPVYKRKLKSIRTADFRPLRARNCDDLIARLASLADVDPPIRLDTHPHTAALLETPTPGADRDYKHREDLIDAAICAWTAQLWLRWGTERCQVLGQAGDHLARPAATIIAPCRDEQRA